MNSRTAIAGVLALTLLAGCSAQTSGKVDFDADEVQYEKDPRTGICYAVIASREPSLISWLFGDVKMTGIGFTEVDCNKVEEYLN